MSPMSTASRSPASALPPEGSGPLAGLDGAIGFAEGPCSDLGACFGPETSNS